MIIIWIISIWEERRRRRNQDNNSLSDLRTNLWGCFIRINHVLMDFKACKVELCALILIQKLSLWTGGLFLHQWHAPKDCGIAGQVSWHEPMRLAAATAMKWCDVHSSRPPSPPHQWSPHRWTTTTHLGRRSWLPSWASGEQARHRLWSTRLGSVLYSYLSFSCSQCTKIASSEYLYI